MLPISSFTAFAIEPFPEVVPGDDLAALIATALAGHDTALLDGDVVVVASKVVSVSERRYADLAAITPSAEAEELAAATGKPPALVECILSESSSYRLATPTGPIIARHRLGYELTSAGVDRAADSGAWLLPVDPDQSARALRDGLAASSGARIAVVIADSDGRPDRQGSTVLAIGAAGMSPLRTTTDPRTGKRQPETFADMVAAAAGIILGQRGRGAPVAVLRGLSFTTGDEGLRSILHP